MTESAVAVTDALGEITFPSRGGPYEGLMPGGVAQVRAWRTSEIKLLVSARKNAKSLEKALDRVINSCLVLPPGLSPDDLLFTDGFYALVAQRIHTFSSQFKSEFKCGDCGHKNQIWIDLVEDLQETILPDDVKEPVEVVLPVLKVPVTMRLLRRRDADKVTKYTKTKLEKAPLAAELGDPGYTYRLALQIDTVDGEKLTLGAKVLWVDSLHAKDLVALENALEDVASGVNPVITKTCVIPSCGEESTFILPMSMEFFRPRFTGPPTDS
jgi:hypothetical protein